MTVQPKPRRRHRRIGEKPRPPQRVTTMMNSQGSGARPHRGRVEPTSGLARRHWAVGVSPILRSSSSTLPASLRSRPVTALRRSYGRSDSCSLRPGSARALPSGHPFASPPAGLPDSRTRPSDHSVSNHLRALRLAKARYLSADRTKTASLRVFSLRELGASPLARGPSRKGLLGNSCVENKGFMVQETAKNLVSGRVSSRLATHHRPNRVSYRTD